MGLAVSRFSFPTATVYGPGALGELPWRVRQIGSHRPLVVTDGGLIRTPAFERLTDILDARKLGQTWELFHGVHFNPVEQDVVDAARVYCATGCDAVVAFGGGSVLDKLVAHQEQAPRPVTEIRGDVPPEVVRILDRMLAKRPEDRYQTPAELVRDLEPLTQRGRLLPASRIDPARPAPSVLPATASVTPRVLPVVSPNDQPVPRKEGMRWTSLLGCLLVGLILLAAGVGGLIYAIQIGVDKVTNAVKDISSFVKEEQENDKLWNLVQEDWIPPPSGQPLDKFLPLSVSSFSRGSIDSDVQPEGLGLNFPGRRATYSSW